ncbi:unc-89-like protein 2 [Sarcoptes scabiei]|uniref:Unc-89-like protein 2 n=1 Tax=Sarcoptes scabiei TaxID=52283 RepID=A0A132A076_SARSC|nr:unc-89-like protein 2 [Sarcoptes scabiei]
MLRRRSSCQITQKHDVLGDRYNFPVFDPAQIKNSEELSCETEPKLIPEKDVLTIKRLLLKNDVLDNPSQMLRKKFKEKNWLSSEEMMKNEMRKEDSNRFEAKIEETIQGSQKQSDSCRENYDPFLRSDKKQTIQRFKMNRIDSFEVEKDAKVFNNNKIKICEHNSKRYNNNFKNVYEVILDYKPPRSATDEISLKEGQEVIVLSKDKPHNMIVRELIETEEDLIRDMQFVLRTYIRQSESSITPKEIKAVKDTIFDCFKDIFEFHKDVLLRNFQTLAKEPSKIGTLFLKMQPEFAKHSKYCQNLPKALEILDDNLNVGDFFQNYSVKIRDEKALSDHLKLPMQRLNDYQLLLKELSKNLSRLDENVDDLEKAIKFIATIPGDKLDQGENQSKDQKETVEKNEFLQDLKTTDFNLPIGSTERLHSLLKNVLQAKLPEVEISEEDSHTLIIKSKKENESGFPIRLRCKDEKRIQSWIRMINSLPNNEADLEESNEINLLAQQRFSFENLDENNNKIKQSHEANPFTESRYKDDKILQENDRVKVLFQSKEVFEIVIYNVQKSDEGIYKCVAASPEGIAETQCKVTVSKDKNVFLGIENEPFIEPGDLRYIRSQSPAFKWFKDGKEFEASERFQVQFDDQEDTVALIFQHVTKDDIGLYTCVANTSSGKISCSAELNVQGIVRELPKPPVAPEIVKELTNVEVCKGQSLAMLDAQISGFPRPIVKWYKDNRLIENDERFRLLNEGEESYALIIRDVKEEDMGKYKLQASNRLGFVESYADLVVVKPNEKISRKNEKIEIVSGEKLIIEHQYEATETPIIKWLKDGEEINESDRIKCFVEPENRSAQLVIQKTSSDDTGTYECKMNNESKEKDMKKTDVIIKSPPKILKKLSNIYAEHLESVVMFEARITGKPNPEISWYKESRLIESNEKYKMIQEDEENYSLVIKNIQNEDIGQYKIKAKNDLGYDESEAELIITKKSKSIPEKDEIECLKNEKLIIEHEYQSLDRKPSIEWSKDGVILKESAKIKIVQEDNKVKLCINDAVEKDAGVYSCKIIDDRGDDVRKTEVIVKGLNNFR